MLSAFTRGIVLLPNDDVLPTADASTERFEENLLPNGALLPNSAHMSFSSLYQFLVLTLRSPGRNRSGVWEPTSPTGQYKADEATPCTHTQSSSNLHQQLDVGYYSPEA
jgi:hypothetical protein